MKSVVLIPGRAPHWVGDHARHLGQRLTETGRVMVVFTHSSHRGSLIPGNPGNGSVLGHSSAGYPIWTGRMAAGLGVRRRSEVTVIVLWVGANPAFALWAAFVARLRHEQLILDVPELETRKAPWAHRIVGRALSSLASTVVSGHLSASTTNRTRVVLFLCGDNEQMARLAMQTFDGMSDAAANRWTVLLQSSRDDRIGGHDGRRFGNVEILRGAVSADVLIRSDVLIADFGGPFEGLVHEAVLTGGAGVLLGQPVAGRVARCHDGVWLAQRNSAAILVALEASSGDMFDRPGTVFDMRRLTNEIVGVLERDRIAALPR